jgi:alkylation response protein AidB-like acyl-CoA dehydrogenase
MPNLGYSDVESELRDVVRDLIDTISPWQQVLARTEAPDTVDAELWRRLRTGLGVTGLPVGDPDGGAGASWRETAVVMEELGAAVAAVPFLGSAVCATAIAQRVGATDLLGELASGVITAAVAAPCTAPTYDQIERTVSLTGETCSGVVEYVADAAAADVLLVPTIEGPIVTVAGSDAGVRRVPVTSLDMTRQLCTISFDDVPMSVIADGREGVAAVDLALSIGAAMLASEQVGLAEKCLFTVVDYLSMRRQFGRILGSYQALKHRLADLWLSLELARATARYAAQCIAQNCADARLAASLAKAMCSDVAVRAAEECIQLHGGIGLTWEHPAHLYLCRAKTSALMLGSADWHRSRIGDLVGITL